MFGSLFVAGFHIKKGEIGMNELFLRAQFFGFVAFGNRSRVIAFSIMGHPEGELRLEMVRLVSEDIFQLADSGVVAAGAEVEHRVVVLILERRHNVFDKGNVVQEHKRAQVPLDRVAWRMFRKKNPLK